MKLALIPPFNFLEAATEQEYQLLLPHNFRNENYAKWASEVLGDPDQFTILDNGLAEDRQADDMSLLVMASHYKPSELVVPDVLGNAQASIDWALAFVKMLKLVAKDHPYRGRLAFVAQGEDWGDALECATRYMEHPLLEPFVRTIMIPRHLVTAQQPHARLLLAEALHYDAGNVDIHLLGGSRLFPDEIRWAATDNPFIRGMDTSLPYVFGIHGVYLGMTQLKIPPHRNSSEAYWHWSGGLMDPVIRHNVETFRRWAAGDN